MATNYIKQARELFQKVGNRVQQLSTNPILSPGGYLGKKIANYAFPEGKSVVKQLSTPQGQEQFQKSPATNLQQNVRQYIGNRYVAPIAQVPYNLKQTFGPNKSFIERGAGALGVLGGTVAMIPDPIGDIVLPLYDYAKGVGAAKTSGNGFVESQKSGLRSLTGQQNVGLGTALGQRGVPELALNFAELPLMLLASGRTKKSKDLDLAVKRSQPVIENAVLALRQYDRFSPADQIKIIDQAERVAKEFIPEIMANKEFKKFSISQPGKYLEQLANFLENRVVVANHPEINIGLKTQAIKRIDNTQATKGVSSADIHSTYRKLLAEGNVKRIADFERKYLPKDQWEYANPTATKGVKTGIVPQTQPTQSSLVEKVLPNQAIPESSISPLGISQTVDQTNLLKDVSSANILPQKGKLNVQNLNVSDDTKKLIRTSDLTKPTIIGNKDVIKSSALTKGAKTAMSDAQMQEILAKRLNSRQSAVTLANEFDVLKKSGADEATLMAKFSELSDQSRVAKQESVFAGRQLQAQKILADELATPQQKVLALLDNAGVTKEKYLKDAINVDWNNSKQVVDFYRKHVPPKLGEILTEFRYTNMLSSPLTHLKNISTNLFQSAVLAPVEKTITGALDWVKSKTTGSERQYYTSDGINYAKGFYKELPSAWKEFKDIVTGKKLSIKPDMERIPVSTGGLYKSYTTPLRALDAADHFFIKLVKGGESASMKNRGLSAEQIEKTADSAARYRLFRQAFDPENKTGQGYLLSTWDKYNSYVNQLRRLPGGNWIVPFLQTPTNILKQGVEYSPFGLATLPGSSNKLQQLSKTIIGSTVFAGTYGLLNSADFTWEVPSGAKEREYFYAAGMQPYSIKVGDKWVSYSNLGPLSYPIAMAAALRYAEKYDLDSDKRSAISTALGGMLKFFSDQSYVKQLGDLIDSIQTGKGIVGGLKAEITNSVSQLVPYKSFLGWLSRIIDPYNRNPDGMVQSITSQLPGLSQTVEPYYNPITKGPSERSNRFLNAISPTRITSGDKEVENLYKYTSSAKTAYANLKRLDPEKANKIAAKLKLKRPELYGQLVKIQRDEKLNIKANEVDIRKAGVEDGERVRLIAKEIKKLKTPDEKNALVQRYIKLGIITDSVKKQLIQMKKDGEL